MKSVGSGLVTHAAGETTTFAYLWSLTRADGTVLRFTDHDRDIRLASGADAGTYVASSGFSAGDSRTRAQLAVDTVEVEALLDAASVTEADLEAGKYDGARVRMLRVNWANPADGVEVLRVGALGNVQKRNGRFFAELRSLTQRLQNNIGRVVTPTCDVRELGDARCTVDVAPLSNSVTVVAVSEPTLRFEIATARAGGWWNNGIAEFTSGANAGLSIEVRDAAFDNGGILTDTQAEEMNGNGWGSVSLLTLTNDAVANSRGVPTAATSSRETASTGTHNFERELGGFSGVQRFMLSCEVRPVGTRHVTFLLANGLGQTVERTFNLSLGTVQSGSADGLYANFLTRAARCTPIGNGYFRCQWLFDLQTHTITNRWQIRHLNAAFAASYLGVATDGLDLWGARAVVNATQQELTAYHAEEVTLAVPAPYAIAIGDAVTMRPGCNRTRTQCRDKFDNIINFRGFPDVPGNDRALRGV